jgi:hypothetical protein
MKLDRYISLGILFIAIGILLFFTDFLSSFIRPFTHLFLMGSSKGKDILFFLILGLFLMLSQLFEYNSKFKENKYIRKIKSLKISSIFRLKNNTYLKISLIIILATSILGLILEIIIRYQLGIPTFTTFVALEPSATTTSILHSHVYKSVVGGIVSFILSNISIGIPFGVNTGDSLYQYVPELANIIIIILPILFLTQLASLKNRLAPSRLVLIFASTIGLIGIFDGGLFSIPCAGGIYGILFIYFDEAAFDYYCGKLFNNKNIMNMRKKDIKTIKLHKLKSYETFKRFIPHIFLISIILLGFSISIIGSNTDYYKIEIINQSPVGDNLTNLNNLNNSLSDYSILSIQNNDNKTIIHMSPEYNEMELINSLIKSLKGKYKSFSMSWNFNSYLKSNNTNLTNTTEV